MKTDTIGGFPVVSDTCAGCGKPLLLENAWMTDGCPCNTSLGVNSLNETRWRLLMELQQQQSRELEMLRSTTRKSPKVRPYTPREAVEFLGRKATDGVLQFAVTSIEKHRIGVLTPNVCNKLSYEEFAEHYIWADTGEPCGVVEKEDV